MFYPNLRPLYSVLGLGLSASGRGLAWFLYVLIWLSARLQYEKKDIVKMLLL